MRVRIDDKLVLKMEDTSFGTLSKKIAFVRQLQTFKRKRQEKFSRLTPREVEVLTMIVRGNNNPETADLLGISRRTVENHRKSINQKLEIRHQRDLFMYAMAYDLISALENYQDE